jgi:hypothetical protein
MAPKTIRKVSSGRRRDRFRNHPRESISDNMVFPASNEPVTDIHGPPANDSSQVVTSGCLTTMQHQNVDEIWKVARDETIMKQIHPDTLISRSNGAIANVSDVLYDQDEERAVEIKAELNRFIPKFKQMYGARQRHFGRQ